MTVVARGLLIALALSLGIGTLSGCESRSTAVGDVEFGILTWDAAGEPHFVPTDLVYLVEDQPYGWRLAVGKSTKPVRWAEIVTLPSAPETWEGVEDEPNMRVSPDGRTVTNFEESEPEGGYVSNMWAVSDGDPLGEYQITVKIEDGPEQTFRFRFVMPPEEDEPATATDI